MSSENIGYIHIDNDTATVGGRVDLTTTAPYVPAPPAACPSCGHCPTCGRSAAPNPYYYPWYTIPLHPGWQQDPNCEPHTIVFGTSTDLEQTDLQ